MMGEAKRKREYSTTGTPPQPPQTGTWFDIQFLDAEREPQVAPDPDYPNGIDLDPTEDGTVQSCKVALPYPAPRCGAMVVVCRQCRLKVAATVAGRPDDPRSIRLPCNPRPGATGSYPHGISRRPGDEGELAMSVSAPDSEGNMYLDFGKPVEWVSLKRDQVLDWCRLMAKRAGATKIEIEM